MKLLIVRHGDPDYSIDSLTPKGRREAECLAERLSGLPVKAFYVSPLGRAKDTASLTLKKTGKAATECQWLREFEADILRPDAGGERIIPWDWLPLDWTAREHFFRYEDWWRDELLQEGGVKEAYDWVTAGLDRLLEAHGYVREGLLYRAEQANNDMVVLFCHFGVQCVMLGHLLHISPLVLWHQLCAAPSSVTTVATEERREGTAIFRMLSFGDVSHLYAKGEEPSFAARFCECYHNKGERRD